MCIELQRVIIMILHQSRMGMRMSSMVSSALARDLRGLALPGIHSNMDQAGPLRVSVPVLPLQDNSGRAHPH